MILEAYSRLDYEKPDNISFDVRCHGGLTGQQLPVVALSVKARH